MYRVQLPFGVAFLVPSAILGTYQIKADKTLHNGTAQHPFTCYAPVTHPLIIHLLAINRFPPAVLSCPAVLGAEELSAQAMHAIGVDPSEAIATTTTDSTAGSGAAAAAAASSSSSSSSSSRQQRCRTPPVALEASLSHIHAPCQLFFGTHWCYVFLRLHHTLFTRLAAARDMAAAAAAQAGGLGGEKDKDKGSANGAAAAASSSSSSSNVSTGMSRCHLLISLFAQSHIYILTRSFNHLLIHSSIHSSSFTLPKVVCIPAA